MNQPTRQVANATKCLLLAIRWSPQRERGLLLCFQGKFINLRFSCLGNNLLACTVWDSRYNRSGNLGSCYCKVIVDLEFNRILTIWKPPYPTQLWEKSLDYHGVHLFLYVLTSRLILQQNIGYLETSSKIKWIFKGPNSHISIFY